MKIDLKELDELLKKEEILIYDLRDEYLYKEGHIKGAISMCVQGNISSLVDKVKNDEVKKIFYCKKGMTSATITNYLIKLGYKNIYDFGSVDNWTYELERG